MDDEEVIEQWETDKTGIRLVFIIVCLIVMFGLSMFGMFKLGYAMGEFDQQITNSSTTKVIVPDADVKPRQVENRNVHREVVVCEEPHVQD